MVSSKDRIIRPKELSEMLGISRTSIWRFERDGVFPKHVQLGMQSIGWRLSEVNAWLEKRQVVA